MKNVNRNVVMLAVCVVCVTLFGLQFTTARAEGRSVTKWEYKVVNIGGNHSAAGEDWTKQLNLMGEDGWEVVGMSLTTYSGNTSGCYATMKRPKQ